MFTTRKWNQAIIYNKLTFRTCDQTSSKMTLSVHVTWANCGVLISKL